MQEALNRKMFAEVFDYGEPGDMALRPATFDEKGNYVCPDCNKDYDNGRCTLININVDVVGSCRKWEKRRACDQELNVAPNPNAMTPELAAYGIAANGEGFGCHRCPFQEKAYEPDSLGRDRYCMQGDFRIPWNSCCAINGATTK